MSGGFCNLYPRVASGEDSELYKGLLKKLNDRPLTNLVYASYLLSGVADQLDSRGFRKTAQGEHTAEAVSKFFDLDSVVNERAYGLDTAKRALGMDTSITNPYEALNKAVNFNTNNKSFAASLYFDGHEYLYSLEKRDSRTIGGISGTKIALENMKAADKYLAAAGINLEELLKDSELWGTLNIASNSFPSLFSQIANMENRYMNEGKVRLLMKAYPTDAGVRELINNFRDLDNAVTNIVGRLHGTIPSTPHERTLINDTLDKLKEFPGVDTDSIILEASSKGLDIVDNTEEGEIVKVLQELKSKYGIETNEVHLEKDINSLEQAAYKGLQTLIRKRKELKNTHRNSPEETAEMERLKTSINQVSQAIAGKQYYVAAMNYLNEALVAATHFVRNLGGLSSSYGDDIETVFEHARVIQAVDKELKGYYDIVQSLSKADKLSMSAPLLATDLDTLKAMSSEVLKLLEKAGEDMDKARKPVMFNILKTFLGDTMPDGTPIGNILENGMDLSKSFFEMTYAFSRSSNPIVAVAGGITRDAQRNRNDRMKDIATKIRALDDKLNQAGYNSEFMYEEDNRHLISEIDWDAYYEAKKAMKESLKAAGKSPREIAAAMNDWYGKNRETIVVDEESGRMENFPKKEIYYKPLPSMDAVQREYYDEMLKLKAQLETMMPARAWGLYRPPQVRRDYMDVLGHGNIGEIYKGTKARFKNLWTLSENEEDNQTGNILESGEEVSAAQGNYDGTVKKEIPIFFIKPLKDSKELLKDFSSAIQAEASTAVNYQCMHEVLDVVEFMQDYLDNRIKPLAKDSEGKTQAEITHSRDTTMVEHLEAVAGANEISGILQGFIDAQFYGVKMKDTGKWATLAKRLIGYTSVKALALNLKGALANGLMGEAQMIIEACGAEFFDPVDYIWAHGKVLGASTVDGPEKVANFFTNNRSDYDNLLGDYFGVIPGEWEGLSHKRYYRNHLRRFLGHFDPTIGYTIGEQFIHRIVMDSILHNVKVQVRQEDGSYEDTCLYYAFEKVGDENNPTLKFKEGTLDREGNMFTEEMMQQVKNNILYCNQSNHGAMAGEDRGVIAQRVWGRAAMNFRQWMIETVSRRMRDVHYDGTLKANRKGYWKDAWKLIKGLRADAEDYDRDLVLKWKDMTLEEKANARRAAAAVALIFLSFGGGYILSPEDWKDHFWIRQWIYQNRRVFWDLVATDIPFIGPIMTAGTLIKKPMAVTNTIQGFTYPILGLKDIDKTGRYHGEKWNKYAHGLVNYTIPFWKDIEQIKYFDEDDDVFKAFSIDQFYR